jgi:hypothetical protein
MKKWLFRSGVGLVGLLVIAGLLGLDFVRSFQRSIPSYDGTRDVAGLTAPVQILRDRYAVPHQNLSRCRLRAGLCACPGPALADGDRAPFIQGRLRNCSGLPR